MPRAQGDGGIVLDAADQVARHGLRQSLRAHEHVHVLGGLGEEHRGLARRVAPAHHDDLFLPGRAGPPRRSRRSTRPRLRTASRFSTASLRYSRARGDDDGPRGHGRSVVDSHGVRCALAAPARVRPVRHAHLSPELLRLGVGAPREILPGDAGREAEIVLDLRARGRPGLPVRSPRARGHRGPPRRRTPRRRARKAPPR